MLIDSNIIIYSAHPAQVALRDFIARSTPAVSAISYVEVLGYHRLIPKDLVYFETFFSDAEILPLDQLVLDRAVRLRQTRKMGLGDALIAATCLIHDLTLVTRNTDDFVWINVLRLLNPLDPA